MKSKAHLKKCLELGVSMSSVEDNEADEGGRKYTHMHAHNQLAKYVRHTRTRHLYPIFGWLILFS